MNFEYTGGAISQKPFLSFFKLVPVCREKFMSISGEMSNNMTDAPDLVQLVCPDIKVDLPSLVHASQFASVSMSVNSVQCHVFLFPILYQ